MELFIQISQLLLMLSLLVILHEFGHYLPAKWFGVKVEKFFLFFDVKFALFKKKIGETVYGVGWLPLGGYVKLAGMIDESMDKEQMKEEPKPYEFRSKPAWQRLIVMLGGVTVNLILAIIIFSSLVFTNGVSYTDVNQLKHGIVVDSTRAKLGLVEGDIPVGVNGTYYESLEKITQKVLFGQDTLTVKRNGEEVDLVVTDDHRSDMLAMGGGGYFEPRAEFRVDSIALGTEAERIGLKKGDEIVSVNGDPVLYYDEFKSMIQDYKKETVELEVNRNGVLLQLTPTISDSGTIGFISKPDLEYYNSLVSTKKYNFFDAIAYGFHQSFDVIGSQIRGIKLLTKVKDGRKQLAGPIGLVKQMPKKWDWGRFWTLSAVFSAWLAFINLLPIPALDGGHALFCLYEIITGKKPGDKFLEKAQIVGFVILMALMIFIFGNDIVNLFTG